MPGRVASRPLCDPKAWDGAPGMIAYTYPQVCGSNTYPVTMRPG